MTKPVRVGSACVLERDCGKAGEGWSAGKVLAAKAQ